MEGYDAADEHSLSGVSNVFCVKDLRLSFRMLDGWFHPVQMMHASAEPDVCLIQGEAAEAV